MGRDGSGLNQMDGTVNVSNWKEKKKKRGEKRGFDHVNIH